MLSKGHRKEEARQLPPLPPDPLGEKLVRLGFVANAYLLDINMAVQAHDAAEMPVPWSLPSRLMQFPIRVSVPSHGAPRRLTLTHPGLEAHPFVQWVEAGIGDRVPPPGADDPIVRGDGGHALDLIAAGRWRDLLTTLAFTAPSCVAGRVSYGLSYPGNAGKGRGAITTCEARKILAAVCLEETVGGARPKDCLQPPRPCAGEPGAKARWPVNTRLSLNAGGSVWALVRGLEAGWLTYDRNGYIVWSPRGVAACERGAEPASATPARATETGVAAGTAGRDRPASWQPDLFDNT